MVNGILLGHPFTRTLRKLEDLIWRAVWMPFAPAMPPIEPLLIYVRIYTRSQIRAHTHTRLLHTSHARSVTLTPSLLRVFARVSVARSTRVFPRTNIYKCTVMATVVVVDTFVRLCRCRFLHFMIYHAAFSGPQSVLKARRLIKEIIEDAK